MAGLLAIPAAIGSAVGGAGAAGAGPIGAGLGATGIGAGAGAPAAGASIGGALTGAGSVAMPIAEKFMQGIDTGMKLGDLIGMNPDQQQPPPQQIQPPAPVPQPLQQGGVGSPGGFSPSALVILQAMLNKSRQGGM